MKELLKSSSNNLLYALLISFFITLLFVGNMAFLPKISLTIKSTNRDVFQISKLSEDGAVLKQSLPRTISAFTTKNIFFAGSNSGKIKINLGNGDSEIRITKAGIYNHGKEIPILGNILEGSFHGVNLLNYSNGELIIITNSNDPYVILEGNFQEETRTSFLQVLSLYLLLFASLIALFFILLTLLFRNRKPYPYNGIQNLKDKGIYAWLALILIINYAYLVTIPHDSALYLEMSQIIGGQIAWQNWDLARGLAFPLLLHITTSVLGNNMNALIGLFSLFHWLLFCALSALIILKLRIKDRREVFVTRVLIFFFIVLDPIVFGYYHTVLIEPIAATLLVFSVSASIKILENASDDLSVRSILKYFLFFFLSIPLSWSLKQPYFLVTLIPFSLGSVIAILKVKNGTKKIFYLVNFISVILVLVLSIAGWNSFIDKVNVNDTTRSPQEYIDRKVEENVTLLQGSSSSYIQKFIDNYMAIANIYYYDVFNLTIDTSKASFISANENDGIAYRIFTPGETNTFPLPEAEQKVVSNFKGTFQAPDWLNNFFVSRTLLSNTLFSTLYLYLPLLLLFFILLSFLINGDFVLEVIGLSAIFGSAVLNTLKFNPIDRYLFPGYPLLLALLIFNLYFLLKKILTMTAFKHSMD